MKPNRLLGFVEGVNARLPKMLCEPVLTVAFNTYIRYAGTTGIKIRKWNRDATVVDLKNRWRAQNHLGGLHATAMATLAESATGMLFGLRESNLGQAMHNHASLGIEIALTSVISFLGSADVPDTHLPLLKSIRVNYLKVAKGDLRAVATLDAEAKERIATDDKGSVIVPVTVTDSEGKQPIECELEWAWTKKRKKKDK